MIQAIQAETGKQPAPENTKQLIARIMELLAEGWPLRSVAPIELATRFDIPLDLMEQLLEALHGEELLRATDYSYGTVYVSAHEIRKRALAHLRASHGWQHQHDIERSVGWFNGVYTVLDELATEGRVACVDTEDGPFWRMA